MFTLKSEWFNREMTSVGYISSWVYTGTLLCLSSQLSGESYVSSFSLLSRKKDKVVSPLEFISQWATWAVVLYAISDEFVMKGEHN